MTAPIALQLYSLREAAATDYAAVVRQVAELGYVGVEPAGFPGSTPEAAGQLFRELRLQVPSAHTALPLGDKQNEVLDAMAAIGCTRIVAGKGPDDFKTLDMIHKTCDVFNEANDVCRKNGLTLGIHNHWWEYLQVEGRYVYRIMLEQLDPAIQFELDTYWIRTAGVDPAAVVKEIGRRAPLLHIKDGPCVKSVPQVAVGEGVMDFPAIVRAGGEATEWMIVELDHCATDMAEAVAKSYRYLVRAELALGK